MDTSWSIKNDWQAAIAKKPSKTIEDYFLLLPGSMLDCENEAKGYPTVKERKAIARNIDIKNGYVSFFNAAQLALFRNRDAKVDIIAIQIGKSGAGASCGSENSLLQFDSDKKSWKRREDLLPKNLTFDELFKSLSKLDLEPYFYLPQKGVDIQVKDESKDSILAILHWNGKRFIQSNPSRANLDFRRGESK